MNNKEHVPVLLGAVLEGLNLQPDGCYVDGTFGRGGHSRAILQRLSAGGRLLAIDRDPQAVSSIDAALRSDPRFEIVKGEIAQLDTLAAERGLGGKVDGLLLDLGVSSPQLADPERGFSFQADGPLDMRMDPTRGAGAAEWLANVDERGLRKVLAQFGEERHAKRIAAAIVAARRSGPIRRTGELADIVAGAVPRTARRIHPATKTFQAIRIVVNRELEQLDAALAASVRLLRAGGRLCVISFHSLEDRLVKRFMRDRSRVAEPFRGLPEVPPGQQPPFRLIGRAIRASEAEIESNPRARSARLRIAERM